MNVNLLTNTPQFYNDISESIRAYLGHTDILLCSELPDDGLSISVILSDDSAVAVIKNGKEQWTGTANVIESHTELEQKRYSKRAVKMSVYNALKEYTKIHLAWGSLTGIRPTRLIYEQLEKGESLLSAKENVIRTYDVTEEKAQLLLDTVKNQLSLPQIADKDIDLYIGIPFCPSRCYYCSFASYDADRSGHKMADYVTALEKEVRESVSHVTDKGYNIRTVYIGGGTPTALTPELFARLLKTVKENTHDLLEFTVEAGRPDTITREKLLIMKEAGVTRTSINPQSMNQKTLDVIGRKHTVDDIVKAFEMADEVGFDSINTDLIVGLTGETKEDFEQTLSSIIALQPNNITVHTLALKRGSVFAGNGEITEVSESEVAECVRFARERLAQYGYEPYYLYRQKYMTGSLENVGYSKGGTQCIYNVDIMEEVANIIACGAGAISKRVFNSENRIERSANVKNIDHYIQRTNEMMERKKELFD